MPVCKKLFADPSGSMVPNERFIFRPLKLIKTLVLKYRNSYSAKLQFVFRKFFKLSDLIVRVIQG